MHRTKGLLRLFESGFVARVFLLLLFLSILGIVDGYVLLTLGEHFGKYFVLAATATTGLIALFFLLNSVSLVITRLRRNVAQGTYPKREYAHVAGLLGSGILLLLPGFFTDGLGLLLYLPPVRVLVGLGITSRYRSFLKEAYEYLKAGDI